MDLVAAMLCIFHSGKVTKFDRLLSDDLQQMSMTIKRLFNIYHMGES